MPFGNDVLVPRPQRTAGCSRLAKARGLGAPEPQGALCPDPAVVPSWCWLWQLPHHQLT